MAQVSVLHLLTVPIAEPFFTTTGNKASLSTKQWASGNQGYVPIREPQYHDPTFEAVNRFLAADQLPDQNNPLYTADASDRVRLGRLVFPLNWTGYERIHKEGDTVRDFQRNIGLPVSVAFGAEDHRERSESGYLGPHSSASQTVDHLYSLMVGGDAENEQCKTIGELKRWGVIDVEEWKGTANKSNTTLRLGQEMRG